MLASYFLLLQIIELGLYALAGVRLLGWSVPASVALAFAGLLASRLAFVLASFAIARLHRRRPGPAIGVILGEWIALTRQNLLDAAWERVLMRPDPAPRPGAGPAIVMAHGYFENRGCFRWLVKSLEERGLGPVFTPNLRSWLAPIERYEEGLAAVIARAAEGTGRPVVIVAHSMGGLAARLYLARRGGAQVARLITIASPHHGSCHAHLGAGPSAAQMCPGSDFLAALQQAEGGNGPPVPVTSIYTEDDNLVSPVESSRLPWARNVALSGYGHIEVLRAEEVLMVVVEEVRG